MAVSSTLTRPGSHWLTDAIDAVGEWSAFALHAMSGLFSKRVVPGSLISIFYEIGFMSVPVVAITGTFIGMVLAVQTYGQYHNLGLDTWLGANTNVQWTNKSMPNACPNRQDRNIVPS